MTEPFDKASFVKSFRLLALVALAAFLLTACAGSPASTPTGSRITFAPSTADCAQATALTAEGYPQRAVALIDQLNQNLAKDEPPRCVFERGAAFARIAAADRLARAASALDPPPPYADLTVLDNAVADCPLVSGEPQVTPDTVLRDALGCDRENTTALDLNSGLGSATAQTLQDIWAKFVKRYVSPWQDVTLAFLIWLAAVFVTMQLLPLVLGNCLTAPRNWVGWIGVVLVWAGAWLGTVGVVLLPGEWPSLLASFEALRPFVGTSWTLVPAIGLTVIGTLLWDAQRRGQKKLLVTVDGTDTEKSASNLRGIISDMGAAGPRGLKMPSGSDASFLGGVDLTVLGEGISKAVTSVLLALKPNIPWTLAVSVVSDDRLAVTLKRNHREMAAEIIDRSTLKVDQGTLACIEKTCSSEASSDSSCEPSSAGADLWPFAGAIAICWMAKAHGIREGLGGATNWRAMGLQHLATTQLKGRKTVAMALLGRALDLDPGNQSAGLAYWYLYYDQCPDVDSLLEYEALLTWLAEDLRLEALNAAPAMSSRHIRDMFPYHQEWREEWEFLPEELPDPPANGDNPPEVQVRQSILMLPGGLARAINSRPNDLNAIATELQSRRWTSTIGRTLNPALLLRTEFALLATRINLRATDRARRTLRRLEVMLAHLREMKDQAGMGELIASMQPLVDAAKNLLGTAPANPAPPDKLVGTPPLGGPKRHYAEACSLAEADAASNAQAAVKLLKRASLDPDLASWRERDPQLKTLRETQPEYWNAFLKDPPSDVLALQPFDHYRSPLRTAGLTTAALVHASGLRVLVRDLGIPAPVARHMRKTAALVLEIADYEELSPVALLLAEMLEKRNILTLKGHPRCLRKAVKAVSGYKGRPSRDQLALYFREEPAA